MPSNFRIGVRILYWSQSMFTHIRNLFWWVGAKISPNRKKNQTKEKLIKSLKIGTRVIVANKV